MLIGKLVEFEDDLKGFFGGELVFSKTEKSPDGKSRDHYILRDNFFSDFNLSKYDTVIAEKRDTVKEGDWIVLEQNGRYFARIYNKKLSVHIDPQLNVYTNLSENAGVIVTHTRYLDTSANAAIIDALPEIPRWLEKQYMGKKVTSFDAHF